MACLVNANNYKTYPPHGTSNCRSHSGVVNSGHYINPGYRGCTTHSDPGYPAGAFECPSNQTSWNSEVEEGKLIQSDIYNELRQKIINELSRRSAPIVNGPFYKGFEEVLFKSSATYVATYSGEGTIAAKGYGQRYVEIREFTFTKGKSYSIFIGNSSDKNTTVTIDGVTHTWFAGSSSYAAEAMIRIQHDSANELPKAVGQETISLDQIKTLRNALSATGAWSIPTILSDTKLSDIKAIQVEHYEELRKATNSIEDTCACNCNYCTCNCNYCTCNCNYSCTCTCNYSDKRLKENIKYI